MTTAMQEWKSNWLLVLASTVGTGAGIMHLYTTGFFIVPLGEEFGWSRSEVTSALTIVSVASITCAAFVGVLIDRFGPRRVGLIGLLAYPLAYGLLSSVSSSLLHWWGLWVLVALSVQLVKPTVWAAAVASRFNTARGLAMAVTLSGTGIASTLNPVLAGFLLQEYGWRTAYMGLAAVWAAVSLPLCFLYFYGAADNERLKPGLKAAPRAISLPGVPLREAALSARFWQLAIGCVLTAIVTLGLLVHFVPIVVAAGLTPGQAAAISALSGASAIVGRLGTGFLLDRYSGPIIAMVAFSLPGVACALLLTFDVSTTLAIVVACLVGVSMGAETDIAGYLTTKYFGLRHFGALFGGIVALLGISTATGPLLAALAFDISGAYTLFFTAGAVACAAGSLLVLMLGKYPDLSDTVSEQGLQAADVR